MRISFSNMFKEFKSTPTWLQFPFQCGDADGSMSVAKSGRRGKKKIKLVNEEWSTDIVFSVVGKECHLFAFDKIQQIVITNEKKKIAELEIIK